MAGNSVSLQEEDNLHILKNIDKEESKHSSDETPDKKEYGDLDEEEDPEELARRQEELLEEFLEEAYAQSKAEEEDQS